MPNAGQSHGVYIPRKTVPVANQSNRSFQPEKNRMDDSSETRSSQLSPNDIKVKLDDVPTASTKAKRVINLKLLALLACIITSLIIAAVIIAVYFTVIKNGTTTMTSTSTTTTATTTTSTTSTTSTTTTSTTTSTSTTSTTSTTTSTTSTTTTSRTTSTSTTSTSTTTTAAPFGSFTGVQLNFNPASLPVGWSECYRGDYAVVLTTSLLSAILSNCNRAKLMLGCRPVGNTILMVAAAGFRNDVLYNCGTASSCTYVANGVGWYYSNTYSWGFVNNTDTVVRNSCDVDSTNPNHRLCWHTDNASGGYRCGAVLNLNGATNYERVIFHAN